MHHSTMTDEHADEADRAFDRQMQLALVLMLLAAAWKALPYVTG